MDARLGTFVGLATVSLVLGGCLEIAREGDWNNPFDPGGANFHPPTIGLGDTAIRDAATGVLQAGAQSPVATIERCAWTVDGAGQDSAGCTLPTAGWSPGNHVVTISATDATGLASPIQTVNVWIGNQPPRLDPIADWRVGSSATVWKDLVARDLDGTIASVSWDTVPDRYSIVSESVHLDPLPAGGVRTVHWRAQDNDGDVSSSSFTVGFVPAPKPEISMSGNGTGMMNGSEWYWKVSIPETGIFSFQVSVDPSGFPDEPFTVVASGGGGGIPSLHADDLPPRQSTVDLQMY